MSLLPATGLEDHSDGSGNINSIVNGNWDILESWADICYGLTASQATTVITSSAPVFIADMVGASVLFADGTVATITVFTDSQHVTVTPSQTVSSQAFKVYRSDQSPYTLLARGLTKVVRYVAGDDGKILCWDNTLLRYKLITRPSFGVTAGNILFGGGGGADSTSSNDLNFDNTNKILAVNGGATFAGTFYGGVTAVAASTGSTTIDGKLGNVYNVTLSANTTIDLSNIKTGAEYVFVIRQDGTGSRTLAWAAKFKFPNGTGQAPYSAANAITVYYAQVISSTEINLFAAKDFFEKSGGTITGATTFSSTVQCNGAVTVSANLTVNSGGVTSIGDLTLSGKVNGIKVYRALLTQTGTSDPTATVLENSLGGTLVWTRSSAGTYVATLTGAFPSAKAHLLIGSIQGGTSFEKAKLTRTSADALSLVTKNIDLTIPSATATDAMLVETAVEIRVYP